jgi:hypothetical protein
MTEYTREFAQLAMVAARYGMCIDVAEPDQDVEVELRGPLRLAEIWAGGYDCHVSGVNLAGIRLQLEQISQETWQSCRYCNSLFQDNASDPEPDRERDVRIPKTITLTLDEAKELFRVLRSEPELLADPSCDEDERAASRELIKRQCDLLEARIVDVELA